MSVSKLWRPQVKVFMYPECIKGILWKSLLLLSPEMYEKRKVRVYGFAYPEYFNSTKSIFMHIPKSAGSSIGMALYGRQVAHAIWQDWYDINPRKFRSFFKFAVIRNPAERFVSAFYFLKGGGMNAQDKQFGDTVLKDYDSPNELAGALVDHIVQEQVLSWLHFRPQAEFVADESGRSKMDLLIRFENIDAGFKYVAQRLHCETATLPHLNKSKSQPETHLEKEARDILACLYRKDIILWEKQAS
jgi:chondroitin 4-sulfotransferase 11